MTSPTADGQGWRPIETAPRDRVVLVNDTTAVSAAPWAAAKWLDCDDWEGWVYDDDILQDNAPCGPQPTHWYDLPSPPTSGERA